MRRVVEGAMISCGSPMDNNKSFTQEDCFTNWLVLRSLNINLENVISAPDALAVSSSPVQVMGAQIAGPIAGADADEVPNETSRRTLQLQETVSNDRSVVRRSARILARNRINDRIT